LVWLHEQNTWRIRILEKKCNSHHAHVITPKEYSSHQTSTVHIQIWRFIPLIGQIHIRNKFIHTEIEYFIPFGTNFTLNQVSSHPKLATWRRNVTPNTDDIHTHKETGSEWVSWMGNCQGWDGVNQVCKVWSEIGECEYKNFRMRIKSCWCEQNLHGVKTYLMCMNKTIFRCE
jgi:hypothetical protein